MSSNNRCRWLHARLLGRRRTLYKDNRRVDDGKRGREGCSSFRLDTFCTVIMIRRCALRLCLYDIIAYPSLFASIFVTKFLLCTEIFLPFMDGMIDEHQQGPVHLLHRQLRRLVTRVIVLRLASQTTRELPCLAPIERSQVSALQYW